MAKLVNMRAKKAREEKERAQGIVPRPQPIVMATAMEREFLMLAATVSYEKEDFARAVTIYKSVEVLMPEWSKPATGRGMAHFRLKQFDEAEAAYKKAVEIDAKDQEAHLYLGELLWHVRHDRDAALQHLVTANTLDANSLLGRRAALTLHEIHHGVMPS